MNIGVVGTGYVGLVVGACFAETGNYVICVDNDAGKVDQLLKAARSRSTSPASTSWSRATWPRTGSSSRPTSTPPCKRREVIFIAVGTPPDEDGSADLTHVLDVAARNRPGDERLQGHRQQVHGARRHGREGARGRRARLTKHPFAVVSNPEFLKEGTAIDDFLKPDRVVIGTDDPQGRGDHDGSSTRRSCAPASRSS